MLGTNLMWYDWLIVVGIFALMLGGVLVSRGYMRGIADFLAAGRTAGRYVVSVSSGIAMLGAITMVNMMEMNYEAGFTQTWWGFTMGLVILALTVTGWVNYRFRQTRALTLSQFFEMRYSRSFRVFAGLIAFISGLVNFGIFPAVGARFFLYYCGLPEAFTLGGLEVQTFPVLMLMLLSISLFFVFSGGQVAVVLSDFIQGLFVNAVFVILLVYVLTQFNWTHIAEAMAMAPAEASKINPFHTSHMDDFNLWYFLIGVFGVIYGAMSWQGTQGYNASARSAHEAKMGGVLSTWRGLGQATAMLLIPIVAYTVMHHSAYTPIQESVSATLSQFDNPAVQSQLRVPLVLTHILPHGLIGAFAALMLAAFISTHDTYLHSWGSILMQDVILPLRGGKPLPPKQHLLALKLAILFVAIFIFFFSLWFRMTDFIAMFFAITGAIFAGGSGAVIIGGLYWKRGTAAAAWSSMITGSSIAVGGIVIRQIDPEFFLNGQEFWGLAMLASSTVYVLVSLAGKKREANMDKLLHRGKYDTKHEIQRGDAPARGWKVLAITDEFTRSDRMLYVLTYAWTLLWGAIFGIGTIWNLTHEVNDAAWMTFWRWYLWLYAFIALVVLVWFSIGGVRDVRDMLKRLANMERDVDDNGVSRKSVEVE